MKKVAIVLTMVAILLCSSGCFYKAEDITHVVPTTTEQTSFDYEAEIVQTIVDALNAKRKEYKLKALTHDEKAGRRMTKTLSEYAKIDAAIEVEAFRSAYGDLPQKGRMYVGNYGKLDVEDYVKKAERLLKNKEYSRVCVGVKRNADRSWKILLLISDGK